MPARTVTTSNINKQVFDFILVLDFEATCDNPNSLHPPEIIELPVLCLDTTNFEKVSQFHRFVRPVVNPLLTPFCTDFTGITQETVDKADTFVDVFKQLDNWIKNSFGLTSEHLADKSANNFAIMTCGNWDLKTMLPLQCKLSDIPLPDYAQQWINVKFSFTNVHKRWPRHMGEMMDHYNIVNTGRLHSGIDDCHCIAKIAKSIALDGHIFSLTNMLEPKKNRAN